MEALPPEQGAERGEAADVAFQGELLGFVHAEVVEVVGHVVHVQRLVDGARAPRRQLQHPEHGRHVHRHV